MKEAGYVYITYHGEGGIIPDTVGWSLISFTKVQIHTNAPLTPMLFKNVRFITSCEYKNQTVFLLNRAVKSVLG